MTPIAHPLLGLEEGEIVLHMLASAQIARVAAFERRFAAVCRAQEAVAVSSGAAALQLALMSACAGVAPVYVGIEPDISTLDPAQMEVRPFAIIEDGG